MKKEDQAGRQTPATKYNSATILGIVFVAICTLIAFVLGGTEIWLLENTGKNR